MGDGRCAPSVTESVATSHRQQQLYWNQLVELKVAQAYVRRYRDEVATRVRWLGILRAVASSGGIAGWAVWRSHAFVWGAIIAASQVADALRDVFPFTRIHKAASEHMVALDSMLIDALLEWENVFAGRLSDAEIMNRRHRLMKLQHEAERKNFPDGLAIRPKLFALAQQEASDYFRTTYSA